MRAEQLAASIIADARKKAHQLEQDSMQEIRTFEDDTLHIIHEKKREASDSAKKFEAEERARKEAQEQRSRSLELLKAKQEIIDAVFDEAAKKLGELSGNAREKLLESLWNTAKTQLTVGSVQAVEKDVAFFKKKAKVTERLHGLGGFSVVSKDGKVSIDMTFETLLEDVRAKKLQEVTVVLFQE